LPIPKVAFLGVGAWELGVDVPLLGFGWRLLVRSEVTAARENLRALEVGTRHADFHLPPRAVLLRVGGGVREAVLGTDLRDHLVVRRLDVLHRRREKRLAPGRLGNLLQVRALLDAPAGVFEEADG